MFKLIQAKRPLLTEYDWGFKWSGSHLPIITSDYQNVKDVLDEKDPGKYDKAVLKFSKPLYYNQTTVVHFKAIADDSDHKSGTYVESKVKYEVDVIHYRIVLKHKAENFDTNAIIERKKIKSDVGSKYEKIKEIPFDKGTKSYEYHLFSPEIGYYYRISWVR